MVGQAFSFNGSNQCVQIPYAPSLANSNYSVEAWVKPLAQVSDPINQNVIFGQGYGQCLLLARPGNTGVLIAFQFGVSHFTFYEAAGTSEIPIGQFTHLAGTWDGTTLRLYINGVLNSQNTPGAFPVDSGCPFYIGGFYSPAAGDCSYVGQFFNGLIDEVSYYQRSLSAAEIQAIYLAGGAGKCPTAPSITAQPVSQTVATGTDVTLSAVAAGTLPLGYQWQFNGTNLTGATAAALILTNVQVSQSGSYSLVVTNAYGSVTSSNAVLTVNPAPPCTPPPPGLVSWWRGEGSALDQLGLNNGMLQTGTTFASGEVDQAFIFDGVSGYVNIPKSASLDAPSQLTIDFWMNVDPAQPMGNKVAGLVTSDFYGFEIGTAESKLGIQFFVSTDAGGHFVSTADLNSSGAVFPAGEWHHIAGVYDGTKVQLYLDGQALGNATPVTGQVSSMLANSFVAIGSSDGRTTCGTCFGVRRLKGMIDEVDYFNRALSAAEIAAIYAAGVSGKCLTPSAPYIYVQPANQVATVGGSVTFSVGVAGTAPLSYQWSFGGLALEGATNATLILTNVLFSQAGNYSVVITNVAGTASSSNATLSVNFTPASVSVVNVTNAQSGATVNAPVSLAANGNENGLSFSLDFNTNSLTYVSTALGSGASGATLLTNATQAASGKLGVILALPPGQTFAVGTQEMVEVTFMTAVRTNAFSTTVSFGDVPIVRELSDASGNLLVAAYASGVVWIQAAAFEGDVSPRPNGDKALTLRDWVQEGRFVAGLDYPTNASEFQRADCAPRATLGDGAITVIDWVQVGRYAAQLDRLTVAGGPTNYVSPGGNVSKPGSAPVTPHDVTCVLAVANTMVIQGSTGTASVLLESMGDENALGFSLVFDPSALNYVSASLGSASNGVTMFLNDSQAGAGRLGFVLGLGTGQAFVAGSRELVRVTFRAAAGAKGNCPVLFVNQPVVCQMSDANAAPLAASYVNGTITVNPLPSLSIGRSGADITLAWPLWATNFGLQAAEGGLPPAVPWTNLVVVPTLTTNEAIVTLPLAATNKVYRLHQP
jgi:hypothetical protein